MSFQTIFEEVVQPFFSPITKEMFPYHLHTKANMLKSNAISTQAKKCPSHFTTFSSLRQCPKHGKPNAAASIINTCNMHLPTKP